MTVMERFYRMAGITFRVTGDPEQLCLDAEELEAFRVEGPGYDQWLEFSMVSALHIPEGECLFSNAAMRVYGNQEIQTICAGNSANLPQGGYRQICRQGNHSRILVLCRSVLDRIRHKTVLSSMELEHQLAQRGGFLLHASVIAWKGFAILFTAPSGTGKSTQAELWERLCGAEMINGDRCAVTVDARGATAWGVPFCGTSGIFRNESLPLGAIVYLSQAPVSSVGKLAGFRAFRRIWEGCSVNVWNQDDVEKSTEAVMNALQRVPVLHLSCTPDKTAVDVLRETLEKELSL